MNLTDTIQCRKRKRPVTIDVCETGYCNADALDRKDSPCYHCRQGRKTRAALRADVTEIDLLAVKRAFLDQIHETEGEDAEDLD